MKAASAGFFTSHQVAELLDASPSAVLRWIDEGLLRAHRTPGGHRRVASPVLLAFLREHQMPVPRELEAAVVRLLVIDDEGAYLKSLGALLARTDARIEVSLADHAVDGLLRVGLERPDVVLLDAYMPGLDGVGVCRRIKAAPATAGIHVIGMSGRPSAELEQAFHDAGAAAFLPKPLTAPEVALRLQALGLISVSKGRRGGAA